MTRREYIWLVGVAVVLVSAVWLVQSRADEIRGFIEDRPIAGVVVYLLLNVVDAVAAPGATLPLIPVVSQTWGHAPAALTTMAGWTAGSLLAFFIARRWGVPLVTKITPLERVRRLRGYIPGPQHLFWGVVLIRAVLPMDVISYALGLFTDMEWRDYTLATALGLAPSAFFLAFVGRTPHAYTWIAAVVAGGIVLALLVSSRKKPA